MQLRTGKNTINFIVVYCPLSRVANQLKVQVQNGKKNDIKSAF